MKNNLFLTILIFLLSISLISCKKESSPGLSGEWISTDIYTRNNVGNFEWTPTQRTPQIATFYQDNNRFSFFTDVPGGAGTYQYERSTSKLRLNFEKDIYGNLARQEIQNIESITEQQLVTTTMTTSGELAYKIRYVRN